MANARIRYQPLYMDGVKLGDVHTNTNAMTSGDEAQYDAEGYAGHSDGAPMSKISATSISPVTPSDPSKILDAYHAKKYVEIGQFVNGKYMQATYRIISCTFDTDRKSGKMEGKFEFEGGEQTVN